MHSAQHAINVHRAAHKSEHSEGMMEMKPGDIYRWQWRDEERTRGRWGYHCKSQIAVVHESGRLVDTYWDSSPTDGSYLKPEDVCLTFLGNPNDMTQISHWQVPLYRREDIVDMRHPNSSSAKIYLKNGAQKNATRMLEEVESRRRQAVDEKDSAQRTIERMDELKAIIAAGDLDKVFL